MEESLVSARRVAEALVELATAPDPEFDAAETTEIAGPREERLVEAALLLAARRGQGLRVEETSDPSDPDSERYANGAALPGPDAKLAGPTFEEWLDATVPASRAQHGWRGPAGPDSAATGVSVVVAAIVVASTVVGRTSGLYPPGHPLRQGRHRRSDEEPRRRGRTPRRAAPPTRAAAHLRHRAAAGEGTVVDMRVFSATRRSRRHRFASPRARTAKITLCATTRARSIYT